MTRKEVHNILDQPRRLAVKIKRLTEEREALIGVLMPGGMSMDDRIQKTPEDLMAKIMAEVADIDEEIERLNAQRANAMLETVKMIRGDDKRLLVLSKWYVSRMAIKDIAKEMNYAESYIYRLRREGLEMIGEERG